MFIFDVGSLVATLIRGKIGVIPHDLLKVRYWREHLNAELLPSVLRDSKVWSAVKNHNKRWHYSDVLSAAVARQFFDGDEYVSGDLNEGVHYFIPVYERQGCINGFIEWPLECREKLHQQMMNEYLKEYKRGGNWEPHLRKRFVGWFSIIPEKLKDCCSYFVENHVLQVMRARFISVS